MKVFGKWGEGFWEFEELENGVFAENLRSWGFLASTFERPRGAFERQGQGKNMASGHSNAPGRRSNAKAKPRGRSNARAIFTQFCLFASVSSCILLSRHTWIVLGYFLGIFNIDITYIVFDLLMDQNAN